MWTHTWLKKCFGVGKHTFLWEAKHYIFTYLYKCLWTYILHDNSMPKLMGNVSQMLFKDVDGLHCPEKYLSFCLQTLWGIKDESEPFSSLLWLWSSMETATNIYVGQTLVHWGTPCSCVGARATKGDDALSHWWNLNLHPCAQDLKQAQQQQEPSLEKSQLCPQAPLSSAHLTVKTLAHFKRHSPQPLYLPHTHTHVSAHTHTYHSYSHTWVT